MQSSHFKLHVTLAGDKHSLADARVVFDAVDGLVVGSILASALSEKPETDALIKTREVLTSTLADPRASRRFYPGFHELMTRSRISEFPDYESEELLVHPTPLAPLNPMDAGVVDGIGSFVRRSISQGDKELHDELFGMASVLAVEHRSPLLLEVAIGVGASGFITFALVLGSIRAAVGLRRRAAEADIREVEASIRREELAQKRVQTDLLKQIHEAVQENGVRGVSPTVLASAVALNATPVADLGSNPLIGEVSIKTSTGGS